MPLIQWIMQNLQIYRLPAYTASGTIFLYGDQTIANFSENYFKSTIKFSIGSKGYDLSGSSWTIIGISAFSNSETLYTAKKGNVVKTFRDTEINVNQVPFNCLNALQACLDKPMENLPTYEGKRKIRV